MRVNGDLIDLLSNWLKEEVKYNITNVEWPENNP